MFSKDPPLVIGMVHFPPLPGRPEAPTLEQAFLKSKKDLDVLIRGGMPAVMFENMYDQPHTERLDVTRAARFLRLVTMLTKKIRVPFGLSILWNDYPTAFHIARATGASWIRVPVFVDSVKTAYGIFRANPIAVLRARRGARAENVHIFADVQVKHAELLKPKRIEVSAAESMRAGADALIITGSWTGEPPDSAELKRMRARVGSFPILIGSGMTPQNLPQYTPLINGLIVGTALKVGAPDAIERHRMRAPWTRPVSIAKVRAFMTAARRLTNKNDHVTVKSRR